MARGNQKERAREKNLKAQAGVGKKTGMTGTEFAKAKDDAAAIMRRKQAEADAKKAEAAAAGGAKK